MTYARQVHIFFCWAYLVLLPLQFALAGHTVQLASQAAAGFDHENQNDQSGATNREHHAKPHRLPEMRQHNDRERVSGFIP